MYAAVTVIAVLNPNCALSVEATVNVADPLLILPEIIFAPVIVVGAIPFLRYNLKVANGLTSPATLLNTYKSPVSMFAPPPVLSMLKIASLLDAYMLGFEVSHNAVLLFHFLTTYFAPKLGVVVFIHTLPVGLV